MAFKRVVFFLLVLILIPLISYFGIRFARGERFNLETKKLTSTGLLVTTSVPDGASVYLDGKLKTATDDTINLVPGQYQVEIKKDGFHPWKNRPHQIESDHLGERANRTAVIFRCRQREGAAADVGREGLPPGQP